MNKYEIIKDYVLKDRNRFSLASDIYDHFGEIREHFKDTILALLEREIKSEIPKAKIKLYHWHVNNQYIDMIYNDILKIQIQFWNYFKTPRLIIEQTNEDLDNEIANKIKDAKPENNRVYITLNDYKFNKVSEILDLFDLFHDDGLKKELLYNFNKNVLEPSKIIYKIFEDFNKT